MGGKTGTTNDDRDIWFVGMTPGMTAAVWIGFDDNSRIPRQIPANQTRAGDGQVNSSRQPIYVWQEFVAEAMRGVPTRAAFDPPEGISFQSVNVSSGLPDPGGVRMAFTSGTDALVNRRPTANAVTISIPVDRRTDTRATAQTPREHIGWVEITPDQIGRYASP